MYAIQKTKVQAQIKKEISKKEERITREIKENKDGGKKMWGHIRMMKGEKVMEKSFIEI